MLFGLQVENSNGQQLTTRRALLRNLAELLCIVTLLVGYLLMLFTNRRQALHDLVSGTVVVVREPSRASTDPEDAFS